ncbi:MAG: hypothetical protein WEB00_05355 [Dehalococcoidia bacterium]
MAKSSAAPKAPVKIHKVTDKELGQLLRGFEERFGMPSTEFYEKWNQGLLGDSKDFFEWSVYCYAAVHRASRVGVATS